MATGSFKLVINHSLAENAFVIVSCEGPRGTAGADGADGNANVTIVEIEINENDNR